MVGYSTIDEFKKYLDEMNIANRAMRNYLGTLDRKEPGDEKENDICDIMICNNKNCQSQHKEIEGNFNNKDMELGDIRLRLHDVEKKVNIDPYKEPAKEPPKDHCPNCHECPKVKECVKWDDGMWSKRYDRFYDCHNITCDKHNLGIWHNCKLSDDMNDYCPGVIKLLVLNCRRYKRKGE